MNDTSQMKGPEGHATSSRKTLWVGVAAAAVAAAVIVVVAVLPAEFGIDPTGIGRATGLTGLAGAGEADSGLAPVVESGALRLGADGAAISGATTTQTFTLEAYGSIEYKYRMTEGAQMAFAWESSAPLFIDMHAHNDEIEESYSQGESSGQSGVYAAQFDGIHGWFFQNRNLDPVEVTLEATGGYDSTLIIDEFGESETPVN